MNSSRLLVSLAVVGLVATITPAQLISLEISPATLLPMPQTLSVTVTNGAGVGLLLPVDAAGQLSPVVSLHLDGPGGPIDPCNTLPLPAPPAAWLAPCGTATQLVPINCSNPGDRWMRVEYQDPAGGLFAEWFSFTLTYGSFYSPVLTALSPARIGQPLNLRLSAGPGESYVTGLSLTTNHGFPVSSALTVGLDPDPVFQLSVFQPPAGVFTNFQGTLDGLGDSPVITVQLPLLPSLVCGPLHAQSVVLDATGQLRSSNVLHFSVLP